MLKKITLLCLLGNCTYTQAFTCYFTVVKDSCWTDYQVNVNAVDTITKKIQVTASIPAKQSWKRVAFDCKPGQQLEYQAKFSPVFWEDDKGKVFRSKKYYRLNNQINPQDIAWDIRVCYPGEFAEVPLPPVGGANCKCDFSTVKPIGKD